MIIVKFWSILSLVKNYIKTLKGKGGYCFTPQVPCGEIFGS